MKQSTKTLRAIALAVASISGAMSGCSDHHTQPATKPDSLTGVVVIKVEKSSVPDWLEAVGTVRAAQTTQIASQIMGTIVAIRAHEGDLVQAGQVLATIDDTQPRAAVQQSTAASLASQKEVEAADSEFTLADATFKRYQQLFDKKSVSPQEFDEIKARRASAEARREMARAGQEQANAALAQARSSLSYTLIHAPFAGMITEKKADVGTMAAPGIPIFTIEDTRRYRLEASVDERDIGLLHVGESASVVLDAFGDAEFHARIAQIVPAADPASRAFVVKLELPPDARLRSGLFGRARIPRGERTALVIPQTALVQRGQLQGVYIVDANREARLAYVTLGRTADQHVEVLSGLREGDKLVAAPGDRDLGGKQVATSQ
jgi:RND family efflux transporter MFP subunit